MLLATAPPSALQVMVLLPRELFATSFMIVIWKHGLRLTGK